MTHTRQYGESEGTLQPAQPHPEPCPKCHQKTVTVQVWESSCGSYEDYKYTCATCRHVWWIDGIDS